ncbi:MULTISPECIES: DUF4331 domain-containing protein [unclassified Variovorax]|jgi:Domain of unknown function (DUF4331)|uniref:DUF4331 domain-containing protein n=1 Tax=unclassified Variovorax TaxID=663243 RepID=UPI0008E96C28|nr:MULTISPECIES: DUF4331 domain-containing protein [unclassified Variovorax]KAF1069082.1 MAG: hypothetical protein GAK39_02952 [Variovorax sp.]TAJ56478.1 MAG: DUF4331 domain-containing protein [Variovorax sp.]SFO44193.1 protein of unknown function [Variovorax sp. PDC80]
MRFSLPPARACVFVLSAVTAVGAIASSHREAPSIAGMPKLDATDFYMFRSYEAGRQDFVTLIANYQPDQSPYGGPNYFTMDPNGLYEIHLDTDGNAVEDITFQFRFKNTLRDIQLPIAGKQVSIPLVQAGGISGPNQATSNLRETYTLNIVRGDRRKGKVEAVSKAGGGTEFDKPTDNIGDKTFGGPTGYATYANQHLYTVNIPGCATQGRVFVGQRKDPFTVALGQVFDLINLNPLGSSSANPDALADKNVTTMALEVPISCITTAGHPIVGGWTTASVRQGRLIASPPKSGHGTTAINGGAWAQVSRLGMPLVNEVVIGLKDKDRFNSSKPQDDAQFADYVTNPTLPALVQTLFSAPAPTNFPRTDLVAAFLTGVEGVNKPANVKASEMLRLNTSIAPTVKANQSNLGVLGGDNAGFPNGRRPGDDVVDAELRVAMGVLCVATGASDTLKVGCKPADAPAGSAALTDGAAQSPTQFPDAFPYLNTPLPGSTSASAAR